MDYTGQKKKIKTFIFICVSFALLLWGKSLSFLCFSAVRKYIFVKANAILQHFSQGQIESPLTRIQFKSNPQFLRKELAISFEIYFHKCAESLREQQTFRCGSMREKKKKRQFFQWVNQSWRDSEDQGWRDKASLLLHVLLLPSPAICLTTYSLLHCDWVLYLITPWRHRSIDILVLLCRVN